MTSTNASGVSMVRRKALGLTTAGAAGAMIGPGREADAVAKTGPAIAGMISVPGRVAGPTPLPVRRGYVRGRFGQIHYRITKPAVETGKLPLVCFHMSPNSSRVYERFVGFMGTDRVCIAPDTPGFGDSDAPAEPPHIRDYAGAMGDLIDAMGLGEVDVMGYHTGSETCVEIGHQRPDQVRRIVMVSAPIFTDKELVEFRNNYALLEPQEDGSHMVEKWRAHQVWRMDGWTLDHLAYQINDALRRPDISWWGHRAAFDYPFKDRLKSVNKPVLVLNPEDDLVQYSNRAKGLAKHLAVCDLPGWSHGFLDLKTEETVQMVRAHLDGEG